MNFKKNVIIVDGREASYWEKNHTQKSAIIFLHGFPGSHKGMMEMAKEINGHRLIVPDLPGCGESAPFKERNSLKGYAKWVSDFLDKLSVDKAIVVGHSFGARVALTFGDCYPGKTEKLALITPVVKVDSLLGRLASLDYKFTGFLPLYMQKAWLFNKVYRKVANVLVYKTSGSEKRKQLIKNTDEEIKKVDARANMEIFSDFYGGESIADGRKINIDTLIIAGGKDEIATLNSIQELCNRFTDAKIEIMKNAGHLVVLESPKAVANIIKKWL